MFLRNELRPKSKRVPYEHEIRTRLNSTSGNLRSVVTVRRNTEMLDVRDCFLLCFDECIAHFAFPAYAALVLSGLAGGRV
jgi:hypothetical protein